MISRVPNTHPQTAAWLRKTKAKQPSKTPPAAILRAATIVASLQTVGNILILALLVTPPATARLLTDRLGRMMLYSMATAIGSGVVGLYISYHANTAAGATIVLVATVAFVVAFVVAPDHGLLAGWLQGRRGKHHVHHYHPVDEDVG